MNAIRTHHLTRKLCMLLVAIFVGTTLPLGLCAAAGDTKSVLVFPLANATEGGPAALGEMAAGALTLALGDTKGLEGVEFSASSPSVRRAISEGRIRQVDVEEPQGDLATCLAIGLALKADYIVLGNIQSLVKKDNPVGVDVMLAGQMYEVAANVNPDTKEPVAEPKVAKAYGASGSSMVRARNNASEETLILEALRDAAAKAAAALAGQEAGVPSRSAKRVSGDYKWVLLGLLIGGLALAANSSNGGGAVGPSPEATPPTNVVLQPLDGALRLTWEAPRGTTLTVLRYEVARSINGGSWASVDGGLLDGSRTSFDDVPPIAGTVDLQYRIRVRYSSGDFSAWVPTPVLRVTL